MKARLFHATVVFLLTFVFSTLSVYAQDEDILIEPPLTWSINSIQIVWSVTQGATQTQETKFIYGADQVNSETFGKERDTENGTTTGLSASGGVRIDGSAGMEYNPLKGFGLLGAKVNASAYVEGGFNYNRTNRTTNTTQWSESEKNIVSQALTSAFQQSSQQTISNQRLVFTVDFVNHTDSQLEFDPRYNNGIPIFLGNTNIGKATPVGIKEAIISIPATGEPVPIEFEMPLDDSRKLTLLKDNRPLISINKGQLFFRTSVNEPEIEGNIFRKSLVATSYFTVAILSGNEVKEWKIRFDEDSPVTVKEALDAINKSNRKKQNTSKSVFSIKNNHFISVCKAPFSSENNSEWITELKVYKDEDEQTVDISDPDSCLTDTPQMGDRYIFQLVSQEIKNLKARGKAGDSDAICELAYRYFNGDGVPEDKVKAVKLYRKAAEQGNAEAQFKLGVCFYRGDGVSQDKDEALVWINKALIQGYRPAKNFVDVLENESDSNYAGKRKTFTINGVEFAFRWCPAGTYTKANSLEKSFSNSDKNQQSVTINNGFWILETVVTNGMFNAFVNDTGYKLKGSVLSFSATDRNEKELKHLWKNTKSSSEEGLVALKEDDYPVMYVSWDDAIAFSKWLERKLNRNVFLPTEVQWDYAYNLGIIVEDYKYYKNNSESVQITIKDSNPLTNLTTEHNRICKICEWCADWLEDYSDNNKTDSKRSSNNSFRVIRGIWYDFNGNYKSTFRYGLNPSYCLNGLGFRVIME